MTRERDLAAARFRDAFPDLRDAADVSIAELRRRDDLLWNSLLADDAVTEEVAVSGVPCVWVAAPGARANRVVVWFHGGGYTIGSAAGRRAIAAEISRCSGARVLVPDYRLAPENPFPAAVQDAVEVISWATSEFGPDAVIIGGDSAGGGLALAALVATRDDKAAMPAGAAFISPLADWTLSSSSHESLREVDEFVTIEMLVNLRPGYLGEASPDHPLVSPALADLGGLPPLLVLVGSDETLLDDARTVVRRAIDAGGAAELHVFDGMFHIWPMFSHPARRRPCDPHDRRLRAGVQRALTTRLRSRAARSRSTKRDQPTRRYDTCVQ